MAKNKPSKKEETITPETALAFLEDMRLMASDVDEPTVPISLRIPANVLRAIKTKAKADGKKYQSLIVEYLRRGLRNS